jgi:hypothetical protein
MLVEDKQDHKCVVDMTNPTLGDFETEGLYSLDSLKKPQVRLAQSFIGNFPEIVKKNA